MNDDWPVVLLIVFWRNKMKNIKVEIKMIALINFLKVIETQVWGNKSEYLPVSWHFEVNSQFYMGSADANCDT